MTAPVFAANDTIEYRTDEAGLARFAEVHDDTTTPAEWADDTTRTAVMLAWVMIGAGVFWIVAALVIGRWVGVW